MARVPEGWRQVKLKKFLTESRLPGSDGAMAEKLTVKLYGRGVERKDDKRRGSANTKYYIRRGGQFIYSKLDFLNGAFGVIPEDLDGLESTLDLPAFDVSPELNAHWLLEYVTREAFYEAQRGRSRGGRKARRVPPSEFLEIELSVPPRSEQDRIINQLDAVDCAIQTTQALLDQTRKVKKDLLACLLNRGIGHTRFKKTVVGEIPEGWELLSLSEVCEKTGLQTGPFGSQLHASEYTEEGIPVVMPRDLKNGKIDPTTVSRIPPVRAEDLDKHRLQSGDIVFARRGDIGRCALVGAEEEGWVCGTGCLRARPSEVVLPTYLLSYMQRSEAIAWLCEHAVGQTMLNLNTKILGRLPVPIPPLKEQETIRGLEIRTEAAISSLRVERKNLQTLRTGLLQDLLTGRVRVPAA